MYILLGLSIFQIQFIVQINNKKKFNVSLAIILTLIKK